MFRVVVSVVCVGHNCQQTQQVLQRRSLPELKHINQSDMALCYRTAITHTVSCIYLFIAITQQRRHMFNMSTIKVVLCLDLSPWIGFESLTHRWL